MTNRKYSRTRNRIHKAMARHPGARKPKYLRMEQSARDRDGKKGDHLGEIALKTHRDMVQEQEMRGPRPPIKDKPKVTKGFLRRLFNRKVG